MSLENLEVHPRIINALQRARIANVFQVLILSRTELIEKLKLTEKDINSLLSASSKSVIDPEPISAFDIWTKKCDEQFQHSKVSLGCDVLNSALRGGLLVPGINEIAGESGSGKTQLCLQMCLTAQLPNDLGGPSGGALFICTEDAFPTKRLHQLAENLQRKCDSLEINLMDNIFIEHAADLEDLWALVTQRIPALLSRTNIKLIIVDSIAALFRVEYTVNEAIERSKALASFGTQLRKISYKHRTGIICVNQVSAVIKDDKKGETFGGRNVIPALGLAWSHMLSTRIMLFRTELTLSHFKPRDHFMDRKESDQESNIPDPVVRKLKVIFAPHIPNNECYFIVEEGGVKGIC